MVSIATPCSLDERLDDELSHSRCGSAVRNITEDAMEVLEFLMRRRSEPKPLILNEQLHAQVFNLRPSSCRSSVPATILRFCRKTRKSNRSMTHGTTMNGGLLVAGGSLLTLRKISDKQPNARMRAIASYVRSPSQQSA